MCEWIGVCVRGYVCEAIGVWEAIGIRAQSCRCACVCVHGLIAPVRAG